MTSSIHRVQFQPFEDDDDSWEELSSESSHSDEETYDETITTCLGDNIEDSSIGICADVPAPIVFWRRETATKSITVTPFQGNPSSSTKECDTLRAEYHSQEPFSLIVKLQKQLTDLTLVHEDTLYHLQQVNQELSCFGKGLIRAEYTVNEIETELDVERLQRELVVELKQKLVERELEKKHKEAKAKIKDDLELAKTQRDEMETRLEKASRDLDRAKEDLSCFWNEHEHVVVELENARIQNRDLEKKLASRDEALARAHEEAERLKKVIKLSSSMVSMQRDHAVTAVAEKEMEVRNYKEKIKIFKEELLQSRQREQQAVELSRNQSRILKPIESNVQGAFGNEMLSNDEDGNVKTPVAPLYSKGREVALGPTGSKENSLAPDPTKYEGKRWKRKATMSLTSILRNEGYKASF